jgi:DNA-binding CsgD family transcriptional regulator
MDRLDERQALDRVLDAARRGLSAALVVRGEPGMGKTSLLRYAADSAAGFRVVRIAGVESEQEFGYAGLHRLLVSFLPAMAGLPQRQRNALGCAFGLIDGTPADRFGAGLAALSLLADAAADLPLLCVVDDAQWLDQESLEVLAMVGRRVHAERIALLFGTRDGGDGRVLLEGIPGIWVGGLPEEDALELLGSSVDGPLDPQLARRIVTETQGCPMAIVELAGELTAAELSGAGLLPGPLPLSRRLEAHFLRQIRALPASTQKLLLVIAAEPSGDPRLITRTAARLGSPPAAAEPAQAGGVIMMYPEARFRHPLIRSAVYGGASPADRRRAHQMLAAEMDPHADADRRAWHLAAAVTGPDEAVAAQLDRAAGRARARGGYSAAGALLARAAQLTRDEGRWAERVLAAAHAHLAAGAPARARLLLEQAAQISDPFQRARMRRLQGLIRYALGQAPGTPSILVGAARALQPFDVHLARVTMLEALEAARVAGRFTAAGESDHDVCRAARTIPLPPGSHPGVADLLLDGATALVLDGHAAAVPALGHAIAGLLADQSDSADALLRLGIGCWAAGAVGDDTSLHQLATRLEHHARETGALGALSTGLLFLAMSELLDGSLAVVRAHFAERAEILATVGRPFDVGELVVLAWRGRETEARAAAAAVTRYATEHGHGWMLAYADYALAVLELGLGNYRAALPSDPRNFRDNPFIGIVGFPDLIEAAARCGEREVAAEATAEFAARALPNGTAIALGLLALSRALLADDADAGKLYQEAIEQLSHCRGNLRKARAHLLYGEWLRRQKRRLDARTQLHAAHEMFVRMGADAFAERARVELAATGERARRRRDETRGDLTPQEAQIALLASQGATNAEIAGRLFLSANTVDYHLRKIFRKLDVTSRRQLAQALPG